MTSLPPSLLKWLDDEAKQSHRTRGDVIQDIVEGAAGGRAAAKPTASTGGQSQRSPKAK